MYIVPKYHPIKYLLQSTYSLISTKQLFINLRVYNLVETILTKQQKLTSPEMGQINITCHLIGCTEKSTSSLLWFFDKYI